MKYVVLINFLRQKWKHLTHLFQITILYPLKKYPSGFVMFSGGLEILHHEEMGQN